MFENGKYTSVSSNTLNLSVAIQKIIWKSFYTDRCIKCCSWHEIVQFIYILFVYDVPKAMLWIKQQIAALVWVKTMPILMFDASSCAECESDLLLDHM